MEFKRLIGIREFYKNINKIPPAIKLISFIFIIYGISWGVIDPYFAIYLKQNLSNYSFAGIVNLILPVMIILLAAPVGRFGDVVGKKKLILVALFFYIFLGIFYFFSRSMIQFVLTRIYHGVIWVFLWVSALGLVRDFSNKEKVLAIGTFLSSYNFGTIIGASVLAPIIVTFFTLQFIFIPLIFTNFLCFLLFFKVPEGVKTKEKFRIKDFYITEIKNFFKKHESKPIAFSAFSLRFTVFMIFFILFLFLKDIGANYIQIALFYAVATIPWVLQAYFANLAEKFGQKHFLFLGFSICAVSLLLIFLIKNLILLFVFGMIASIGTTMILPILEGFVTKIGLRKEGEFTGIYETIYYLGEIFASLVGGIFSDILYLNFPFLVGALLCFVSMFLFRKTRI